MTPSHRPALTFSLLMDFTRHVDSERLIAVGVGPDETVALVLADDPRPSHGTGRSVQSAFFSNRGGTRSLTLERISILGRAIAQPVPGGGLLLVDSLRRRPSPNAWVFDAEGHVIRTFAVGDGVADIAVDEGRLWVSYFDEGIFGGDPLSKSGFNAFDLETGSLGSVSV